MLTKLKLLKIKSVLPQRIMKGLLWTLVVFLILRGIGSILRPSDVVKAREVINEFVAQRDYKDRVATGASAFAASFGADFFTYDRDNSDDYITRLKKYIPQYFEPKAGFNGDVKAEAISSEPFKVDWVSKDKLNVDVAIRVKYILKNVTQQTLGAETAVESTTTSEVYIRVPIAEKDGRYLVLDYPAFIPTPEKANMERDVASGKQVDSDTTKAVEKVVESFFKTYFSGNNEELAYYMLEANGGIKGLDKRFELSRVDDFRLYYIDGEKNMYFATATLSVKDSLNGQAMPQGFCIEIVKKDDRFYIKRFDTRLGG